MIGGVIEMEKNIESKSNDYLFVALFVLIV